MNLREIWDERKQERKAEKALKKARKKKCYTREEKAYKIFGVVFGFLVAFGAIFYSCSNLGGISDVDWGGIVGINQEYLEELNQPYDENIILASGKLNSNDIVNLETLLVGQGINIIKDKEIDINKLQNINVTGVDLEITGNDLGALAKICTDDTYVTVHHYSIAKVGDKYVANSVVSVNLSKLIIQNDVRRVYLTTTAEIVVLSNTISVLNKKVIVNQLSEEKSTEILKNIDGKNLIYTVSEFGCEYIYQNMNFLLNALKVQREFIDNGIKIKQTI